MSTILNYFQWSTVPPHFIKCILCNYVQKCKLKKQKTHMDFHLKKTHKNVLNNITKQHVFF